MSVRFILALILLVVAGASSAAELGFAHYAPGAGTVLLEMEGEASRVLAYKDFEQVTYFDPGTRHLRARRADGSVLAEGDLELLQNDRYIVILAGNGTAQAPYQLRLAIDHNHVFTAGQWSVQEATLAVYSESGESALAALVVQDSCVNGGNSGTTEVFGYGTRTLSAPASGGVTVREAGQTCAFSVRDMSAVQVSITGQSGERLRRFLIGDGVRAPYEMIVVSQGIDPVQPVMAADASIEGLYSIDGAPNTGLQVAYDPGAPSGQRLTAVYFGFENEGRASWRTIEKMRVVEYMGGNTDGTRAAVGFERAIAFLTVHSCMDLSLKLFMQTGVAAGHIFPADPRNTLRLTRLFPPVCPPAVPNGQEELP